MENLRVLLSELKCTHSGEVVKYVAMGTSLGVDVRTTIGHLDALIKGKEIKGPLISFSPGQIDELLMHEEGLQRSKELWGIMPEEHAKIAFEGYKPILEGVFA